MADRIYGVLLTSIHDHIKQDNDDPDDPPDPQGRRKGDLIWSRILREAGLDPLIQFTMHDRYPVEFMPALGVALSKVLPEKFPTFDDSMRYFGQCFVHFCQESGHAMIMRVAGRDYRDFLLGIDNLHETMRFAYPGMRSPYFLVTQEDRNGCELVYKSQRRGFCHYVIGQLQHCASKLYGVKVEVLILEQADLEVGCKVTYRLNFDNCSYKPPNAPRVRGPWDRSLGSLSGSTMFKLLPFSVAFDKTLGIRRVGQSTARLLGDRCKPGMNMMDVFSLRRPLIDFDWENIKKMRNVAFELEVVVRRWEREEGRQHENGRAPSAHSAQSATQRTDFGPHNPAENSHQRTGLGSTNPAGSVPGGTGSGHDGSVHTSSAQVSSGNPVSPQTSSDPASSAHSSSARASSGPSCSGPKSFPSDHCNAGQSGHDVGNSCPVDSGAVQSAPSSAGRHAASPEHVSSAPGPQHAFDASKSTRASAHGGSLSETNAPDHAADDGHGSSESSNPGSNNGNAPCVSGDVSASALGGFPQSVLGDSSSSAEARRGRSGGQCGETSSSSARPDPSPYGMNSAASSFMCPFTQWRKVPEPEPEQVETVRETAQPDKASSPAGDPSREGASEADWPAMNCPFHRFLSPAASTTRSEGFRRRYPSGFPRNGADPSGAKTTYSGSRNTERAPVRVSVPPAVSDRGRPEAIVESTAKKAKLEARSAARTVQKLSRDAMGRGRRKESSEGVARTGHTVRKASSGEKDGESGDHQEEEEENEDDDDDDDDDDVEEVTVLLKGQMKFLHDWDLMVYLYTPHIGSPQELLNLNMNLSDLNLYDPSLYFVLGNFKSATQVSHLLEQERKTASNYQDILTMLEEENDNRDLFLRNMLPEAVIRNLHEQERNGTSEPFVQAFDMVTILFSDIVGFDAIVNKVSAHSIVKLLNFSLSIFDPIVDKHNLFKVETRGDAQYMVAGGVEGNVEGHSVRMAALALEFLSVAHRVKDPVNMKPLTLRIGIHVGNVVSGTIGTLKRQYCLFGDTVNTAARIHTSSQSGRIHLSEPCHEQLKNSDFVTVARDVIQLKGKGAMRTYWLAGRRGSRSTDINRKRFLAEQGHKSLAPSSGKGSAAKHHLAAKLTKKTPAI